MINFIKKSFINLVLIAGFCLLVITITIPLLAELQFNAAEKLAATYKWKDAEAAFQEAIRIDPFSSRYLAGLGDFFVLQAKHLDRKAPALDKAEDLYRRASGLDRRNADIYLKTGLIELNRMSVDRAFENFRKAVENDPNGVAIACSIGYAGIGSWKEIGEADKEFISDRVRYALKIRPWYGKRVYPQAWKAAKDFAVLKKITPDNLKAQQALYGFIASNNLWQFRKEQAARVESYKPMDGEAARTAEIEKIKKMIRDAGKPAGDWAAVSKDGKKLEFNKGAIYSNKIVYSLVEAPGEPFSIKIEARGSAAGGIWPYMVVELDGKEIGETFVDSAEFKEYEFRVDAAAGSRLLGARFINDACDKGKKEDRNLYVGKVKVEL
jgi:hypothetical protein